MTDRALRRARFAALLRTGCPRERERVDDRFDAIEADLVRERCAPPAEPIVDLDGGRGVDTSPEPQSRGRWTDALSILDER